MGKFVKGHKSPGQFKKGVSGNPSGRPKLDEDTKRIRVLTNDQLKVMGDHILLGTRATLQRIMDNPDAPPLQCWIAQATLKGIQSGDMSSLNELLNRLVGKVTEKMEVKLPVPTIVRRRDGTIEVELGAKLLEDKKAYEEHQN